MNKTLKISFALKNTYRVNGILFSLKQIPLLKKLIPSTVYKVRGFKIFANIVSALWEITCTFAGKLIYFLTLVCGIGSLYKELPLNDVFLHILLLLTVIGSFTNTHLFNPSKDKYYAIILMRMDAKQFTIVNYFYSILKVIFGFLPFTIIFGLQKNIPLWLCLLLPFCIAGMKLFVAGIYLLLYQKKGYRYNENNLSKYLLAFVALLLGLAYGLPALKITIPSIFIIVAFLACIPLGIIGLVKIIKFNDYTILNKEMLSQLTNQMDSASVASIIKESNEKKISANSSIKSKRKGFEYLNELFIKRHKKILWNSTIKISLVCVIAFIAIISVLLIKQDLQPQINALALNWLPYFLFIMYILNRGTNFTQALFMNCDHSLLTYSFYKQPKFILQLFKIRLREIIKINAVPALIIGIGLALILFVSGGTENPLDYAVLIVSVVCMSVFFSIHYLTIYYLFQPYNAGTELKSGTYQIITWTTYVVCLVFMNLRIPTLIFGLSMIAFCIIYSIVACVLVYRFAPKTFKIRA